MVTPSAPSCHNIPFYYPRLDKKVIDHLSMEERDQFCDATDEMLKGIGNLRTVDFDFVDGTIKFEAEYKDGVSGENCTQEVVIDIVARKFFEDNKEYIQELHPEFASRVWQSTYVSHDGKVIYHADNMKKISELFYRAYERFKEYHTEDGVPNGQIKKIMMSNWQGGFKSYNILHKVTVGSLDNLSGQIGEKFKKFIERYPPSLLSKKTNEKAMVFLKAGLQQKESFQEQISYLKKVIFLLNFQDLFKGILDEMLRTKVAKKEELRGSRRVGVKEERERLETRISLLEETLKTWSKFPISDLTMLIPLAFRSSPEEFRKYNEYFEKFSLITEDYLESECGNAHEAAKVIRDLLQKKFPEDFSLEKSADDSDILSINRYLMGLSGLTFSQGLMGRVAMEVHRTNTYFFEKGYSVQPVRDNIVMEFLLEVTNCSSHHSYDWMVEKFLAPITLMMGKVSPGEIRDIISEICKLSKIVDELPVAKKLLKKSKSSNKDPCDNTYVLRDSAGEKLYSLCKTVREKANLTPLR